MRSNVVKETHFLFTAARNMLTFVSYNIIALAIFLLFFWKNLRRQNFILKLPEL